MIEDEDVPFSSDGYPMAADETRKQRCRDSLEQFAREYMPDLFYLPISPGQQQDFATMQRSILDGGRYAFAAPRGDGKTTRVEAGILWAALYGHRKCIVIVGADLTAAIEIFDSVKLALRTNERLIEDFPVPAWAAVLSDDTALKAKGWTWGGKSLHIQWGKKIVLLPILDGADGSGCVMVPRGLTGRLRGMRLKVGKMAVRPDLFVIDDPQTDESAESPAQVQKREKLILGAIMGSGGPAQTIAAVMPCTIIQHDDLAARFLDRKRHPDWQGQVRGMVIQWPAAQKTLWREYFELRRTDSDEAAHDFYAARQAEMDAGAVVDWEARHVPGELTALQHAENMLCDLGDEVFSAEYQNNPSEKNPSVYSLKPGLIQSRVQKGRRRNDVPVEAKIIVAATDINHYGLHTAVIGFGNDQTAGVAAYMRYTGGKDGLVPRNCPEPERKRLIFEGLVEHGKQIAALPLTRGGAQVALDRWVIDGGYEHETVQRYVRGAGQNLGFPVLVARGFGFDRYRPQGKGRIGPAREQCHRAESGLGRFIAFNADYWREVAQRAWLGSVGAPGSLSLFDGPNHREFSEQICREKLIEKLRGKAGYVWRWHSQPGWHDYGDAVYMAYVGAAEWGIETHGRRVIRKKAAPLRKPKVAMADY